MCVLNSTGRPVGYNMSGLLRYDDAFWPNLIVLLYIISGYLSGLGLILYTALPLQLLGCLLLAHAMVIAAYMVHECAHNSVFRKNRYHRWLANILLWICGSSYSQFEDIRHKHVRHHTDRADIVSFDYRKRLLKYPVVLKIIQAFEWLYIPALEILMHALVIVLPFVKPERHNRRMHVILHLLLRVIYFWALASLSIEILIYYPLSYILFLTMMRFMDVHQHTYDLFETLDSGRGEEAKRYDRNFEKQNTYSNIISTRHPWLNLLVLNFCYHNAHHEQPGRPWYQLYSLHKKLYAEKDDNILSFVDLLKSYHRYRVTRVLNADDINMPVKNRERDFIGVDGVSFLTAH